MVTFNFRDVYIRPGDLVKNPFDGEFCLYDAPEERTFDRRRTTDVHSGALGLCLAVSGSYLYVLVHGRLGWCAQGMFDRVVPDVDAG